jgi:solute carrier family 25 carnitine/acylcarnitine transporter 20/29
MEELHHELEELIHHKVENDAQPFSWSHVLKDLAAGSLAGVANVASGHPLDTIKVRMQMIQVGFGKCIKSMYQQEGFFAYYKGVAWPFYSIPIVNAVVFAGYESAKKMMNIPRGKEMTIWQGLAAGAWAGFVNCAIVTPVEMVKIQQ